MLWASLLHMCKGVIVPLSSMSWTAEMRSDSCCDPYCLCLCEWPCLGSAAANGGVLVPLTVVINFVCRTAVCATHSSQTC